MEVKFPRAIGLEGGAGVIASKFARDEAVLARFGKKQQLRRTFALLPVIGLTCSMVQQWEAISTTLFNGLENGGPAGLIYGYIFCWIGTTLQALVMAEMSSMIPLAGGPFNWVAILAPSWCKNFLSYFAGWLTVITWQAFVAGTCYIAATLVQGILVLAYPDYNYQRWHGTLLFWAIIAFAVLVNVFLSALLPKIEIGLLVFHLLGFIGVLIPLVYLAPHHQSAYEVFTTFENLGSWSSTTLSTFVGLITAMNVFPGFDAADHIAEEVQNAAAAIPICMLVSLQLNSTLAFGMLLALLFCMPSDISSILDSTTFYPFLGIYQYALGSTAAATGTACVLAAAEVFATVNVVLAASRMLWAFARENGVPFSKHIGKIDERTGLPLYSIAATAVINITIVLINIGSSVGFTALISLGVAAYYTSFVLAACVMLNKRLKVPDSDLPWGPFKLGRAGVPITVAAVVYSIFGGFFSMWPATVDPSIQSMNYCVLVYGPTLQIEDLAREGGFQ